MRRRAYVPIIDPELVEVHYRKQGQTVSTTARHFGVTPATMYGLMLRCKIRRKPQGHGLRMDKARAASILEKYRGRFGDIAAIARQMDPKVSRQAIHQFLRRHCGNDYQPPRRQPGKARKKAEG